MEIEQLLEACVRKCASEMHLAAGMPPMLRLADRLRDMDFRVLSAADTLAAVRLLAPRTVRQRCDTEGRGEFDLIFSTDAVFQAVVLHRGGGYALRLCRAEIGGDPRRPTN